MNTRSRNTEQPTLSKLLWRGATKACPACGRRQLFSRWFNLCATCPRCGLKFERIEGHWAGSLGLNTIVSFFALLLATVGSVALTFPDFPLLRLISISVGTAIVVPVLFFPISRTLWTAIDIGMRPLKDDEVIWDQITR